jgi:hypothetical protein
VRRYTIAPMLFALASSPGSDCGFGSWSAPATPATPMTPALPYCYTDPPVGCGVYCAAQDDIRFTQACAGPASGTLTMQFQNDIATAVQNAMAHGTDLCTSSNVGATISPCMDGIVPMELPNQSHESCMVAPACVVTVP